MIEEKEILRKKYKKIRDEIPNKNELSNLIIKQLIEQEYYKNAKVIALYSNILSEVETNELFDNCIKNRKTVAYPKVMNDNIMNFYQVTSLKELQNGSYGIKEPINNPKKLVSKKDIDLMIIPGICFDKKKNRIGYGKGYYDTYLKDTKCIKVALAFTKQICEEINADPNDIKMDYIITENKII